MAEVCPEESCDDENFSENPIRYSNGEIKFSEQDLFYVGLGWPWGHTRSYNNIYGDEPFNGENGVNWYISQLPYLQSFDVERNELTVVSTPTSRLTYYKDGPDGAYVGAYYQRSTLRRNLDTDEFIFTNAKGRQIIFYGFGAGSGGRPGRFKALVSADGERTNATLDGSNRIVSLLKGTSPEQSGFYYAYHSVTGKLESVRLAVGGVNWRRVRYTYCELTDSHGLLGDLKTAVVEEWSAQENEWQVIRRFYYRYYTEDGGDGFKHGLKFVVGPEAYQRIIDDSPDPEDPTDPDELSDGALGAYADYYFEYDYRKRVVLEKTGAGLYAFTFAYLGNPMWSEDAEHWVTKTVETLPDGSENIAYANAQGQVIFKIHRGGTQEWYKYFRYDWDGRRIMNASSAAVESYNEAEPDLVTLKDAAGLITTYEYYPYDEDPDAQPRGYLRYVRAQEGLSGAPVLLKEFLYQKRIGSEGIIWLLWKNIRYQSTTGTLAPSTTRYEYDEWHGTTFQFKQRTTYLPVITDGSKGTPDQNGSGGKNSFTEVFDANGLRTWLRDERGFLTAFENDDVTQAVTRKIEDVDTGVLPVPFPNDNWQTPDDGGKHLITDYEQDDYGRHTQTLGPLHEIDLGGVPTMIRRAEWTVYEDAAHRRWEGSGYAVESSPGYTYTLINPVRITFTDHADRTIRQIQAVRSVGSGKLSTDEPFDTQFPQSAWTRRRDTSYDVHSRLQWRRVYQDIPSTGAGTEGTNYGETTFAYDARGRQVRERSPGGTITWSVLNPQGWVVETWVGTNATGGSNTDPSAGGTGGNNMVLTEERQYDGGADGGNGNVTEMVSHAGDSDSRTTAYTYDYRSRLIRLDGELNLREEYAYDNLNRRIEVKQYNGATGPLIGKSEALYDNQGRVYKTSRYGVVSGTAGNAVVALTWYDASGNVIKKRSEAGGGGFEKLFWDSVGRLSIRYVACDPNAETYSQVSSVSDDTVLERTNYEYDEAGNLILQALSERNDNASGTGDLQGPEGTTRPSRVTYVAFYPDALGRGITEANYGTAYDSGSSTPFKFTRSNAIPASSNLCLVNVSTYNNRGELESITDPAGTVTLQEFDDAGQLIETIDNYQELGSGDDVNKTTQFAYNVDGKLVSLTAINAVTGNQVTQWVYGTTRPESGVARADLLRAKIYPDGDEEDQVEYRYNRLGELIEQKDQNGTIREFLYDKHGRPIHDCATTLASGIDTTIQRLSRTYDPRGLLETVSSSSDPDPGVASVINQLKYVYNGFGQLVTEYQAHDGDVDTLTTPKVSYEYADGTNNSTRLLKVTYPDGREIDYDYGSSGSVDQLRGRVHQIKEGEDIRVLYTHRGVKSTVRIQYPQPGIEMTYLKQGSEPVGDAGDRYTGLDRFNRIVDIRWLETSTGTSTDRFQYGFDRASNRTWRRNLTASSGNPWDEKYAYDGLYQLENRQRGELNSTQTAIVGTPVREEAFTFDPTGNWQEYLTKANGSTTLDQDRSHNEGNEIIAIDNSASTVAHDGAGNMTKMPKVGAWATAQNLTWDAWNRLTKVEEGTSPAVTIGRYSYDGLHRRVMKYTEESSTPLYRHYFYSDKWQILEERTGYTGTNLDRQFIWGMRYSDDLAFRDRFSGGSGSSGAASSSGSGGGSVSRMYASHDQWHVTAIADTGGTVQERYSYDAFGTTTVLNASYSFRSSSLFDWETRYGAYRWDKETNLYQVRFRYLHPGLGRWISRDPSDLNGGYNLYCAMENDTPNLADPFGLKGRPTLSDCWQSLNRGFERRDAGEYDKTNHCISSCEIARDCGSRNAFLLGVLKELADLSRGGGEWLVGTILKNLPIPPEDADQIREWIHDRIQGGDLEASMADMEANLYGLCCKDDCEECCRENIRDYDIGRDWPF